VLFRSPAIDASVAQRDPQRPEHYRLDVAAAARAQLIALGVRPSDVHQSSICNHCDARTFSYRRDGPRSGRHWALIRAQR
jgi:copper oxidase (laccase) domain-containing protein